jgi:dihydroflavonol-4-reductase
VYPGVASHLLSWLFVEDLIDGLMAASERTEAISQTYFLAAESPVRWRELGGAIAHAMGRKVRHLDVPLPLVRVASTGGELLGRLSGRASLANRNKAALARHPFWVCSASRAATELGFRPRHSLPEAVRETYHWYRQSGWLRGSSRASSPAT